MRYGKQRSSSHFFWFLQFLETNIYLDFFTNEREASAACSESDDSPDARSRDSSNDKDIVVAVEWAVVGMIPAVDIYLY